jgi:hypothetical protein
MKGTFKGESIGSFESELKLKNNGELAWDGKSDFLKVSSIESSIFERES